MLFNSIEFAVFLPIVFLLYWFVTTNPKDQNKLLVLASYFFYGWWDWRFLFLIAFSSLVDYFIAQQIPRTTDRTRQKQLLLLSILVNVGFLGFFKYFNFFVDSFAQAFTLLGQPIEASRLNIVLPVGISFYTFQTLSYSIDVYGKKLEPAKDLVAYFAYVSFFPQLVAGPIERATNFLPQFYQTRRFEYQVAVDGMRQIIWGLFKKIVIADNCAQLVNIIFADYQNLPGSTLAMGALLFAFQIYGDFSGYSDIAIGTGKLFGFNLRRNFALPYFSRDVAEFWRKWHISLTTWFRDYIYIPMGGSRGSKISIIRNTMVIFLVSGFWHGANWTFVVWGALNALYFLPLLLTKRNRKNINTVAEGKLIPPLNDLLGMVVTFGLITLSWVFFRSESVADAISYLQGTFSMSLFTIPDLDMIKALVVILILLIIEWITREKEHPFQRLEIVYSKPLRWVCYLCMCLGIFYMGNFEDHAFIYFQF